MPWTGAALSNGLKLSIRLSSGDDSMTSGGWLVLAGALLALPPPAEALPPPLAEVFELDEQAARPAARSATALAVITLLPGILLIVNFDLSSRILRFREGALCFLVRRRRPRPAGRRRPVASTPPPGWTSAAGGRGCPACTDPRQAGTGC